MIKIFSHLLTFFMSILMLTDHIYIYIRVLTGSESDLRVPEVRVPAILRVPGDSGRGSRWLPFGFEMYNMDARPPSPHLRSNSNWGPLCKKVVSTMGPKCKNVSTIKFHNRSWATFGCKMMFRWSSVLRRTTQTSLGISRLLKIFCVI